MSLRTIISLTCLGLLCANAHSQKRIEAFKFTNHQGKQVIGDLYILNRNEPTVICVELFSSVRESWRDWVPYLINSGLNVLVLDVRGVGPSATSSAEVDSTNHATKYHEMHHNILNAVKQLEQRNFDTTRIALLSSNFGSNILIAATSQAGSSFRTMVMLTPAITQYRRLNVRQQLENWSGPPTYMISSDSTFAFMQDMAKDINKRSDTLKTELLESEAIGNRMLGKIPGIEKKVTEYLIGNLMPRAHLQIPKLREEGDESARDKDSVLEIARQVDGVRYGLRAFVAGDTLSIGPAIRGEFKGSVRITLGDRMINMPFNSEKVDKQTDATVENGDDSQSLQGKRYIDLSGNTSVLVSAPASEWLAEKGQLMRVEFISANRKIVALPATGTGFEVHLIDK